MRGPLDACENFHEAARRVLACAAPPVPDDDRVHVRRLRLFVEWLLARHSSVDSTAERRAAPVTIETARRVVLEKDGALLRVGDKPVPELEGEVLIEIEHPAVTILVPSPSTL